VLLVVFVGGWVFYLEWRACLGGESSVLKEFPHYADPQSGPSPVLGTCQVRYTTEASRKEVLGYYDERLRKNGWEVLGFQTVYRPPKGMAMPVERLSDLSEAPESAGGSLAARRDGYDYRVSYEPRSKENPDPQIPEGKALVICGVTDGGR
jgi:hypothetical protein